MDTNALTSIVLVPILFLGLLVVWSVMSLLLAFPFMWCWNYVMPYLFGLKTLAWGQAWCLSFLVGMVFRSVSSHSK